MTRIPASLRRWLRSPTARAAALLAGAAPWSTVLAAEGAAPAAVDAGKVLQVILGLIAVLLVIGALTWVLRNLLRYQPGVRGQLRVLGGLSMGSRERVVLVQVGGTQLLLGVAPGRVQTLHVLDEPVSPAEVAPGEAPGGFAAQLNTMLRRGAGGGGA